jgi:hypothetical protein
MRLLIDRFAGTEQWQIPPTDDGALSAARGEARPSGDCRFF